MYNPIWHRGLCRRTFSEHLQSLIGQPCAASLVVFQHAVLSNRCQLNKGLQELFEALGCRVTNILACMLKTVVGSEILGRASFVACFVR